MITRFAPSPTGPLHLGHAYSALIAWDMVQAAGGKFLLRIEDTDRDRCRPEWEAQIYDDLAWLGIQWETPVRRQSDHSADYEAALTKLGDVTFGCTCRRADIRAAVAAPQEGDYGPDGLIYPGTCRGKPVGEGAVRLWMERAAQALAWEDSRLGPQSITADALIQTIGDVVLRRGTGAAAYHLAVVVDDALQGVSHVVRGQDLAEATAIHVLLQRLLDLPTPTYHHHDLIRDEEGKRLAKRTDAKAIAKFRADGATPQDIRRMVNLPVSG